MPVNGKAVIAALVGLLAPGRLLALASDRQQPITIVSQQQSMILNEHRMVFSGAVVITQGSIIIRADQVVVTRLNNQPGWEQVEAKGTPATFYQQLDNQQTISGSGYRLQYNAQQGVVSLQQQAMLQMGDNQVNGDRIIYDLERRYVQVDSTGNNRVKMVLMPEQLQSGSKPVPGR